MNPAPVEQIVSPPAPAAPQTTAQSHTQHPSAAQAAPTATTPSGTAHESAQSQNQAQRPVSAGNPCPFLRGLVANGLLPNEQASAQQIVDAVAHIERLADPGGRPVPPTGLRAAAAVGNGLSPFRIGHNLRHGVRLDQLRYGPLYKDDAHSGLLTEQGQLDQAQLARLQQYASPKLRRDGQTETGLDEQELQRFLDDSFARAKSANQRTVYRQMMNFEMPILLQVIGTQGQQGRYLPVSDIARLYGERQFPDHIQSQLSRGR